MAVKVLIERQVRAGYEELVWEMLRDLRGQAVRQRGYLFGETWRSLDNPRIFMVSSTWGNREYWETWAKDDFRRKMEERITRLLRKPATIRLYEELTTLPTPETSTVRRRGGRRQNRVRP
jgi:heme-degrading monooxygenase HmoA